MQHAKTWYTLDAAEGDFAVLFCFTYFSCIQRCSAKWVYQYYIVLLQLRASKYEALQFRSKIVLVASVTSYNAFILEK